MRQLRGDSPEVYSRVGGFGPSCLGEDSDIGRVSHSTFRSPSRPEPRPSTFASGRASDSSTDRWAASELASPTISVRPSAGDRGDILSSIRRRASRGAAYIRRHFDWPCEPPPCRRFRTIRRIARIYWGRPSLKHSALIAIAHLPRPLARVAFRLALGLRPRCPCCAKDPR